MNSISLRLRDNNFTFYQDCATNQEGDILVDLIPYPDQTQIRLTEVYKMRCGVLSQSLFRVYSNPSDDLNEVLYSIKDEIRILSH